MASSTRNNNNIYLKQKKNNTYWKCNSDSFENNMYIFEKQSSVVVDSLFSFF